MPARRISFVNFKGGVGKTSLSVNIAATLANEIDQKVLLVDCDPQSSASAWLMGAHRWWQLKKTHTTLALFDSSPNRPALHSIIEQGVVREQGRVIIKNLDLIPATFDLMEAEAGENKSETPCYIRFHEAMANFVNEYDFIIYDCPPNFSKVCRSALCASDEIFIPVNPDELSRLGLVFLNAKLEDLKKEAEQKFAHARVADFKFPLVRGVIYNAVNKKAKQDMMLNIDDQVETLKKASPMFDKNSEVFTISISQTVAIPQSTAVYRPMILEKNKNSKEEFTALSQYIASNKKFRSKTP